MKKFLTMAMSLAVALLAFSSCQKESLTGKVTYTLNKENRDKLHAALTAEGLSGSLTDMITERFGLSMEKESFSIFCQSHQIEYELHVWID